MLSRIDQKSRGALPYINRQLSNFALGGLRTLVVAQKPLEQHSYERLDKDIYDIQTSDMPMV